MEPMKLGIYQTWTVFLSEKKVYQQALLRQVFGGGWLHPRKEKRLEGPKMMALENPSLPNTL